MSSHIDWDATGFVLVNPDGVARGLAMSVLQRLTAAGLRIGGGRLVNVSAQNMMLLYPEVKRIEFDYLGEYRMGLQLFEYGPSLAVAIQRGDDEPSSVHAVLRSVKGAPDPSESEPGSIRCDLRGINRTLRIVHCSSSPDEARTNCEAFLETEDLDAFDGRPTAVRDLANLLRAQGGTNRGFVHVLAGVRARALAALWCELGHAGRTLLRTWLDDDPLELASRHAGSLLLAELSPPAAARSARILAVDFRPSSRPVDLSAVELELAELGVTLDRWERLVLETSLHTAPFEWR